MAPSPPVAAATARRWATASSNRAVPARGGGERPGARVGRVRGVRRLAPRQPRPRGPSRAGGLGERGQHGRGGAGHDHLRTERLAERVAQAVEDHGLDARQRIGDRAAARIGEAPVARRGPDRAGRPLQVHQPVPVDRCRPDLVCRLIHTGQDLLHRQGVAEALLHEGQPSAHQWRRVGGSGSQQRSALAVPAGGHPRPWRRQAVLGRHPAPVGIGPDHPVGPSGDHDDPTLQDLSGCVELRELVADHRVRLSLVPRRRDEDGPLRACDDPLVSRPHRVRCGWSPPRLRRPSVSGAATRPARMVPSAPATTSTSSGY